MTRCPKGCPWSAHPEAPTTWERCESCQIERPVGDDGRAGR